MNKHFITPTSHWVAKQTPVIWLEKASNCLTTSLVFHCTQGLNSKSFSIRSCRHRSSSAVWSGIFSSDTTPWQKDWRLKSTTVPVGLLRPCHQCCHMAASMFRQPSTACSTSLPSQHLRPPCLFSRRPHSLELFTGFHPGPDHQCRVFQTFA